MVGFSCYHEERSGHLRNCHGPTIDNSSSLRRVIVKKHFCGDIPNALDMAYASHLHSMPSSRSASHALRAGKLSCCESYKFIRAKHFEGACHLDAVQVSLEPHHVVQERRLAFIGEKL